MTGTYYLKDPEETRSLGLKLAESLVPGSVVALTGDLGAGKTTFTKAVAQGLGVRATVSSPTFTIVQEYDDGRLPLYHFDMYRVNSEEDLFELGFDEYIHGRGVCLIEWADLLPEGLLPEGTIHVHLSYGQQEEERTAQITC